MPVPHHDDYGIALIVCDIDGCLNRGKTAALDVEALGKISNYNRNTITLGTPQLALISGRPQPFVEAYSNLLSVFKPCICENGAVMYFPGEDRLEFHPAITSDMQKTMRSFRKQLENEIDEGLPCQIEIGKQICLSANPVRRQGVENLSVESLYDMINQKVDHELLEVTHSSSAVDVTPRGINKGVAVSWLAELEVLSTRNMLGIGDSLGDLAFLKMVGYSGAPANAAAVVKETVDYVSQLSYAEGTGEIIETVLKRIAHEFDNSTRH